ncbi:hypothetical protein LEP1GSC085_0081 [Leptospira interrogans str. L0996]|nr:hypothetical protein LEP1GSC085_0081 [Leptospira interrogans str. L0996]
MRNCFRSSPKLGNWHKNAIEVIWFFLDRPKELFNSKTTKENT